MAFDTLDGGRVEPRELAEEMRSSYLDYAMSVIVGRALPDVRDGFKPVHRRVLYAMSSGLQPGRPFPSAPLWSVTCSAISPARRHCRLRRACAHGPVVLAALSAGRGQGNFGTRTAYGGRDALHRVPADQAGGRDAARHRRNTVDFIPNYDGRHREPSCCLPAIPNLLVNGSAGIAVGMATNIPPHNLGETIDARSCPDRQPRRDAEDLMAHARARTSRPAATFMGATASAGPMTPDVGASSCAPGRTPRRSRTASRLSSPSYHTGQEGGRLVKKIADLVAIR